MFFNAWVEIRNDFDWPPEQDENGEPADTELQAKNRETLSKASDIKVVPGLFKARKQGPRTWKVYSLYYDFPDDTPNPDQAIEQALERFKSENPGKTDVVACWYGEGNMVGTTLVETEIPNPEYVGEPFEIPNPNYQPEQFEADGETPRDDYDPRENLRNPAWVPETIIERTQTGVPLYATPGYMLSYMPDVVVYDQDGNEVSRNDATELTDVNLVLGQKPRIFD